jgi:hypothetical protein
LLALAAAGSRVAVANDCDIRVADLARGTKPIRIKRVGTVEATRVSPLSTTSTWVVRRSSLR